MGTPAGPSGVAAGPGSRRITTGTSGPRTSGVNHSFPRSTWQGGWLWGAGPGGCRAGPWSSAQPRRTGGGGPLSVRGRLGLGASHHRALAGHCHPVPKHPRGTCGLAEGNRGSRSRNTSPRLPQGRAVIRNLTQAQNLPPPTVAPGPALCPFQHAGWSSPPRGACGAPPVRPRRVPRATRPVAGAAPPCTVSPASVIKPPPRRLALG